MTTAGAQSGAAGDQRSRNLRAEAEQVREDLHRLREDVGSAARAGVAEARERLGDAMETARRRASDAAQAARRRGAEQAEALQNTIVERPLTAVAVAFGVGLVLGMLSRRG